MNSPMVDFHYAQSFVKKGQAFPVLSTTAYLRDSATGLVLINQTSGYPLPNAKLKDLGRTIPKHILGWGITSPLERP